MVDVGVIGVGVMGCNHVRILSNLKDANLVAISDIKKSLLEEVGDTFGVKNRYTSYQEMIKNHKLDVVIIVVPSNLHKKVAVDCLNHDLNIFIEKPIAHTISDSEEIISLAQKKNKFLMVGHIERFNPVVRNIREFINNGRLGDIYLINTVRAGPYPKRIRNVGVLIDLAVHDIDILHHLIGNIERIYSQLILSNDEVIYCNSLFKIASGVKGSCEFSWVSSKKTRTIHLYGVKGVLEGNYQDQTLRFYENPEANTRTSNNSYKEVLSSGNIGAGKLVELPIKKEEPLKVELEHLIECIKKNKKPLVTGEDALKALKIALLMLESGKSGKPLFLNKQ